jgi:hypothetical protein
MSRTNDSAVPIEMLVRVLVLNEDMSKLMVCRRLLNSDQLAPASGIPNQ